jgi:succinate dehydrogenase / fumarate reductase cytochrome b subunit
MSFLRRFYSSTIGRKFFVAIAGVLLCGFLVLHLLGNLLIFKGTDVFNHYASALDSNPLIPYAELILAGLFLLHILIALWVRYENNKARPIGYIKYEAKGGRTWGSRTMTWTALLVLAFLIIHLKSFRFGDKSQGIYHLVVSNLQNPYCAVFYIISMLALMLHLSHGVQSAFQSLGVNHTQYTPSIKNLGRIFAVMIGLGFASIPFWVILGFAK